MRIAGWGSGLPVRQVDNEELERRHELPEGWILERTGIRSRRQASTDESTATLAIDALVAACAQAGVAPRDVDLLIVATTTPEQPVPTTASIVAGRLGMACGAFDVSAACTGFVNALVTAHEMMAIDGALTNIAVVGCDVFSRIVDPTDRNTSVLFGDGAGALLIERTADDSSFTFVWNTGFDPAPHILEVPIGGSTEPFSTGNVDDPRRYLQMQGAEVMRRAVPLVTRSIEELLVKARRFASDIDLFIPHQANERIIVAVANRLGIDPARVFSNISELGNTSAASLAIATAEAIEHGRLEDGMLVMMTGFGAGMTAMNALFECQLIASRPQPRG